MKYEYHVETRGYSVMHSLENVGEEMESALNEDEVDSYVELGWELWQVNTLGDSGGGNNGLILIYRKPKG